ncbi:MAG: hypothetical protein EAZ09_04270 [Oscillatoriales cyanobacterium]|nr:MAG: hypothetical protein EAZ09_04270 [Oscillatoriales cyanobacterium]
MSPWFRICFYALSLADWNYTGWEDKADSKRFANWGEISKMSKIQIIWKIRKIKPSQSISDFRFLSTANSQPSTVNRQLSTFKSV